MTPSVPATSPVSPIFRRFTAVFSMLSVLLYLAFFLKDGIEFLHKAEKHELQASLAEYQQQMQEAVTRQSDEIQRVDATRLGWVYVNTLSNTDCNWFFSCHDRVFGPEDSVTYRGMRIRKIEPLWSGLVPTTRTLRGTPHAVMMMARAVVTAGGWAISMFLACSVIWFALLVLVLSSDTGSKTMIPPMMFFGSPLFIPLLVWCVRWVALFTMGHLGWAVGRAAYVAAYSSALAVLVGVRHVWKAPHEIRELTEVLRGSA